MKLILKPLNEQLIERYLLGESILQFLKNELRSIPQNNFPWKVEIGSNLLFDRNGLQLIINSLSNYLGNAKQINFVLSLDEISARDYYWENELQLPVSALRESGSGTETLLIKLPVTYNFVPYPTALTDPDYGSVPEALLIPFTNEFDLLFANQILLLIRLKEKIKKSWMAYLRSPFQSGYKKWPMKVAAAYKNIHPSTEIHPTAVIEGSIIEEGTRVGAHAVIRFSHIGKNVRIHDGAKVELSYVGEKSWLMHDLVLYRSYTEDNVFLIHGPYQFSGFQSASGAFGSIMMDYRPDNKPIRKYRGRFLGSILKPGAKTLGGSLIAPGQIINSNCWLTSELEQIHNIKGFNLDLPEYKHKVLPPSATKFQRSQAVNPAETRL